MAGYGAISFHIFVSACFLLGVYDVLREYFKASECEMSYMFETPQYKKIPFSKELSEKFSRYELYLYGEGQYFQAVSSLELEGIPVLYIPGNGGSMKQSRSVASFLLRKAQNKNWKPHFNVFTINFNEERAAIFGATINDQIQFTNHCIQRILDLYKMSPTINTAPHSVVLVAHSMGGVVARGVFTLPQFQTGSVSIIYTLATPHLYPVISLDSHLAKAYSMIDNYWEHNMEELKNVSLISVSGGDRDFLVNSAVAQLPWYLNQSIVTTTTMVPRAWVSADHQCAVWCKQMVLALTRSLFDMVDNNSGYISGDYYFRSKILRHHFIQNSGVHEPSKIVKETKVNLVDSFSVVHLKELQWHASTTGIANSGYYFFNLLSLKARNVSHVIAMSTLNSPKWILGCDIDSCKSAVDLSTTGYLTPTSKVAKLDINSLIGRGIHHLIFKVAKSKPERMIHINAISDHNLTPCHITVPHTFSNLWTLNQGYIANKTIGIPGGFFYHKIALDGLWSIFHAYTLILTPVDSSQQFNGLLELELPNHSSYMYSNTGQITIKLLKTSDDAIPTVHVFTDGQTEYSIQIRVEFQQVLGQIVRFQWPILPGMIGFNIMLAFSYQLKVLLSGKICPSTKDAHRVSAKPYKLQPFINLLKKLYSFPWFVTLWHSMKLPVMDAHLLDKFGIWFALMPLVTFLFAAEIFSVLHFITSLSIDVCCKMYSKLVKISTIADTQTSFLPSMLHTAILAALVAQSSGMALSYIIMVNFFELCGLSALICKNQKETMLKQESSSNNGGGNCDADKEKKEYSVIDHEDVIAEYNIKLSMHLVWLFLGAISLPSLIAWIEGYNNFVKDPYAVVAVLASFLFTLHRQRSARLKPSVFRRMICKVLYPMTIFAAILCLHSLHRLPYLLLSFLSVYVTMQYFG